MMPRFSILLTIGKGIHPLRTKSACKVCQCFPRKARHSPTRRTFERCYCCCREEEEEVVVRPPAAAADDEYKFWWSSLLVSIHMLRQSALRSVPVILLLRSPSSFPLFSSQARPINCLSLLRVSSSSQQAAASLRNSSSGTTNTMGLKLIPAKNLHVSTPTWWLESRFHFSFAEYYNPQNTEFGVLRVLNDDLVKPRAGFGTHSHRDMEIFTYIIDGKLTHKDSIGTAETLGRGSVQYMSAGRGISHSEMNNGNEMLRFLQIWIKPKKSGLQPNYGSRIFDEKERHNQLQHVLTSFDKYESSKDLGEGVIPIHQDCNIYVSELDPSVEQEFILAKNRQAYLVCIEGSLSINDNTHLTARDATEITAEKDLDFHLKFTATEDTPAHFLMIEMSLA